MPLAEYFGNGSVLGMILGLRFPQGISGMFGGIDLEISLMRLGEAQRASCMMVRCDGVYDFGMRPDYTLIEGMCRVVLTRDHPLLDPARLMSLWCAGENEPDCNKDALELLHCGGAYVIAERFTVTGIAG